MRKTLTILLLGAAGWVMAGCEQQDSGQPGGGADSLPQNESPQTQPQTEPQPQPQPEPGGQSEPIEPGEPASPGASPDTSPGGAGDPGAGAGGSSEPQPQQN